MAANPWGRVGDVMRFRILPSNEKKKGRRRILSWIGDGSFGFGKKFPISHSARHLFQNSFFSHICFLLVHHNACIFVVLCWKYKFQKLWSRFSNHSYIHPFLKNSSSLVNTIKLWFSCTYVAMYLKLCRSWIKNQHVRSSGRDEGSNLKCEDLIKWKPRTPSSFWIMMHQSAHGLLYAWLLLNYPVNQSTTTGHFSPLISWSCV